MASIRVRSGANGTTYAVLFNHGNRQRSKSFISYETAEAWVKVVDAIGIDDALARLDQKAPGRTVDSLFIEWLAHKKSDMTSEAHRDYERAYAKWIKPTFGWRDAELVTERDVQAWVDKTLKPKLAPKSVAKNHALLHGMYGWASSRTVGHIENDPCTETNLPKNAKRPPRGFTLAESDTLLAVVQHEADDIRDAADVVAVAAGTGYRPGEVMGLLAGAVDIDHMGHVYITMLSVYRRSEGIVEGGKTETAGRRLRVLGPGAAVIVRRVAGLHVMDPLFPHPSTGKEWNPQSFGRHYWPKVIKAARLEARKPTPYWLRHTHVALCHKAGLTLPEIQRRLGHKSIQTTMDIYGQMIDGMSDEAAERLDHLLTPPARPQIVTGTVVETAIG